MLGTVWHALHLWPDLMTPRKVSYVAPASCPWNSNTASSGHFHNQNKSDHTNMSSIAWASCGRPYDWVFHGQIWMSSEVSEAASSPHETVSTFLWQFPPCYVWNKWIFNNCALVTTSTTSIPYSRVYTVKINQTFYSTLPKQKHFLHREKKDWVLPRRTVHE